MKHKSMPTPENLQKDGFIVLRSLFTPEEIKFARNKILNNRHLLKKTRRAVSSGHLAGFHRYPQLEELHTMLATNLIINSLLQESVGDLITIGLSDITINRSQEWHCDLLRGDFSAYLDVEACWGINGGGVYKALLYLQGGKSLFTVPGSHLHKLSLDSDEYAIPENSNNISNVSVNQGDVVIMDIRLVHRGSTEEDMNALTLNDEPKY